MGGCGQSPPFSPRDGGGIWQSRAGPKDGLRYGWAIRNVLSGKGAFSPIRRRAQRRTCISIPCRLRSPAPVLPARLPALPERQTAPQHAFPRKPAKIRRATQQRLCPTGANSVAPAPPQRPLPGRARQRRPTRAVPTRHHSSTSAASTRPALPSTPHLSVPQKPPQAAGPCSWACRRLRPPPPHQKRKEAPLPPARGAWARRPRANGAGRRHCRPPGYWLSALPTGPPPRQTSPW